MARARAAGVDGVLIPGTHPSTWARTRACAEEHGLSWALGVHPWFLADFDDIPLQGACAVGECGLDGTRPRMQRQRAVLRRQLELAKDWGLPVLLHCVRAHVALLEMLRPFAPLSGLMHSYSGSAELVPAFSELGLCFSFGGAVTWTEARRPRRAAAVVPLERLFVESDGPGQAPQSRRGGRSEPSDVVEVIEALEQLRGEGLVRERHLRNRDLFGG
ncbi:MAG TPA: TatD family hydrolase [Myxococcota bacterium]|nr:TatD family hydrolase [Myxococcota bacterium]